MNQKDPYFKKYFPEFTKAMIEGIEAGDKKYGDDWRTKDNLDEALAEVRDLAVYAFFTWVRLRVVLKNMNELVKEAIIKDENRV